MVTMVDFIYVFTTIKKKNSEKQISNTHTHTHKQTKKPPPFCVVL